MTFKIRRFRKATDSEWLDDCLDENLDIREKLNYRGQKPAFESVAEQSRFSACWVATQGTELLGFVCVQSCFTGGVPRHYLAHLFVRKPFRGKGVGKALVAHAMGRAREYWAAEEAYALTIANSPMEKLLKKLGFKKQGTYKNFVFRGGKRLSQSFQVKQY